MFRLTNPATTSSPSRKPFTEIVRTFLKTGAVQGNSAAEFMGPMALGPPRPRKMPSPLDQVFLRWAGHSSPTSSSIPTLVEEHVIHRARSLAAVKLNIVFLMGAVLASVYMVESGKAAAARGESLQKQNLDWHKRVNDAYRLGMEATTPY